MYICIFIEFNLIFLCIFVLGRNENKQGIWFIIKKNKIKKYEQDINLKSGGGRIKQNSLNY